jgi:hypothetical protein
MLTNTELTGYIIKEEQVSPISASNHVLDNTFVIHVDHPFPGYYGDAMLDLSVPRSILFLTDKIYTWEEILRIRAKVNKDLDVGNSVTFCRMYSGSQIFPGIRVKGFSDYSEINNYQEALRNEGISFIKKKKMKDNETVLIYLKKFFTVQAIDDNLFLDARKDNMGFASIDKFLTWEQFREITRIVKNNISDQSFDVVKGVFYYKRTVNDMLRIFKPKITRDLLKEIQDKYKWAIERYG